MYKKVLVPLDGSALAECALPEVKRLAQCGCIGEVLLVNVVEDPMRGAMEGMEALNLVEIENRLHDHARKYLADIKIKLNAENIKASPEVLSGRAAQSIVDYAKKTALISLSSLPTAIQALKSGYSATWHSGYCMMPMCLCSSSGRNLIISSRIRRQHGERQGRIGSASLISETAVHRRSPVYNGYSILITTRCSMIISSC
jgi:nucleotide-binding universal stress UspA family protein